MPYGDLERQARPALRGARRPRRGALHGRGARGVRAAPRGRQRGLRRRRLRARPRRRASRRPTSSCGTAATTTSRSSARTCTSCWSTRCGPGTSTGYHPGRDRAAHGRRIVIATRSTSRRPPTSRRVADDGATRSTRARRSCGRPRPSGSTTPTPCAASACSSSRTGRPSRTAACRTAPATSPRVAAGAAHRAIRGRSRRRRIARCSRSTRTSAPVLPAIGYDAGAARGAARDHRRRADADVVVSATPIDLAALVAPRQAGGAGALRVRRGADAGARRPRSTATSRAPGSRWRRAEGGSRHPVRRDARRGGVPHARA